MGKKIICKRKNSPNFPCFFAVCFLMRELFSYFLQIGHLSLSIFTIWFIIVIMKKNILRKSALRVMLCLFLCIFSCPALFARTQNLPEDLEIAVQNQLGPSIVYDFACVDNKKTYFVNVYTHSDNFNKLYLINTKNEEKSFEVYRATKAGRSDITSIIFNPKNQTLYFFANDDHRVNSDYYIYKNTGFYALTKSANGTFEKQNLRRYFRFAEWVTKNVVQNYLIYPEVPDYEGFLKYFFDLADKDVTPVFCYKPVDGPLLTNIEAVKYLKEHDLLQFFWKERDEFNMFPLYHYLFAADENGEPTTKCAASYYKPHYSFCGDLDYISDDIYFQIYNGEVYFAKNTDSEKRIGFKKQWSHDWSEIFKIIDDEEGFSITRVEQLSKIHSPVYDRYKHFENKSELLPFQVVQSNSKELLLINDVDRKSVWLYNGETVTKYRNREDADQAILELSNNILADDPISVSTKIIIILSVIIFVLLILIVLLTIRAAVAKKTEKRKVFSIQEDERRKISSDIHDSIVQDIRAIRLRTEMLKVTEESQENKNRVIDDITSCIVKMRDICYGLSPAELSTLDIGSKTDIFPILQTIGEQYTTKTNIPCSVQNEDPAATYYFNKRDCRNIVRIVQEALKNVEKHSFATNVQIFCRSETHNNRHFMTLFIIDDGKGCKIDEVTSAKYQKEHFGLRMMSERVALMENSTIEFLSAPNDGMQIKLTVYIGG